MKNPLSMRKARRRYAVADTHVRVAADQLGRSTGPASRMYELWDWADAETAKAENTHGFTGDGARDNDGYTLAASHDMTARLLGRIADTEATLADISAEYGLALPPLPDRADTVLAALDIESNPAARAELLLALRAAVVNTTGARAADALAALATRYRDLAGITRKDR